MIHVNLHDANHLTGRQWEPQVGVKELLSASDGPIRGRQPPPLVAATLAASAGSG
jgi:hypothetical protein